MLLVYCAHSHFVNHPKAPCKYICCYCELMKWNEMK